AHVSRAEVSSEHLVHSIMAKKPRLGALLRLTAVPFWFDAGLVTALRARDDGQAENVLALLDQFSFVHTGYGRYWYSGDMRDSLLRQWASDPDGLATAHRRACDYFARRLAESPPGNVAVREEYAAAHLYHLLAVDQRQGIERLLALFREASDEHRLASAEKYVRVAKEHGANLSAESRAYLDYLQGRLLQLQGRWPESKAHLEALLTREGLPPVLSARIRRSVADALVPMGQAANAISLYEQALAQFKAAGDPRQAGLTMVALGNAHLNLALGVWGSGWVRLPPARSWLQPLLGLGHLLVRIPLVLYLLWRLGFRDLLPVVHRIGSEMDWIVARVLVTAADWFHRARGTLGEAQAPGGLVEVREGLAQLYRLLDYPQRAEALNREILEMDAVQEDGYRAARARLGIAHSLLLQGKAGEAAGILEELLPVFRHFEHHRRVAQTQTLLAEATLGLDLPDKALEHHREALAEWLAANDLAAATETVHAMEAIQRQRTLSAESQEIVQETSRQLTERRYRVRYFHPMLIAFAQVALLGLVVLFFFTVRLALRSESGTQIDATASLVKPIERQIPTSEELSPDVTVTLDQQLSPSPPVQAVGFIVVASFIGYLLLYTVVGWLVIVTTPIEEIKPGEVQAVLASPEGIRLIKPADDGEQMAWRDASVLLWSDRIVLQRPLQAFSFFALFNGAGPITVSARTRYYQALQGLVRRRLNEHADREVRTYDLGFDVLHSGTGWLFLASLIYLVGFFVVAALKPELATQNYDPIPYNAVDFYWLAYLGLAFPLAWWFAVQPLRAHWLVSVRTPLVWLVGGAGLVLALISLLQIYRWHLPLGRPDVVTPVLAILLIGVSGSHILRARPPAAPGAGKRHAYSLPVRVATGFVAAVTLAAMLFAIGWELVGTHHLAMGNSHLRAAEAYRRDGDEHAAEEAYTHALAAYDRSLALRAEAYVHNSRGAVLTRLGRYQEALNAYRMAWAANPDEPTYVINQALVYESQASAPDIKRPNPDLYDAAIRILTEAIAQMEGRPDDYRPQLANARLLRGAAYYDRGQIYLDDSKSANARGQTSIAAEAHIAAMSDFARAYNDYAWLVGHYPDRAPGYAGRGWARFRLREGLPAGDVAGERDYLQQAITDFWQALRRDQDEISAKTGLGWAHFYYSQTYAACKESEKDPDEARDYRRHLESAISAYDDVID
ncbi:MAG: hypothetical protein PVG11_08730, partial [Anaerolineae bacterium]